ncbi:iron-containing redox enzyme family protein [Homoserinimonas sp. A447]
MRMPEARGAASEAVFDLLLGGTETSTLAAGDAVTDALAGTRDILRDDDLQLALFVLYELHYRGVDGVDEGWEWHPGLLGVRRFIEHAFETRLREVVPVPETPEPTRRAVADALFTLTETDAGPSLSRYVARSATDEQLHEFLIQRSIYQLKEADPHSWAIPRLEGVAKAALVEIQSDEYGGGRPERVHQTIYRGTMEALGLDPEYGAYANRVSAITFASTNLMSLFGLHRRLRGAIVGHLAAYEMTSSIPCKLVSAGFQRNGYDERATHYFDEHVEADAVHEQIAGRDLAGGLVEADPRLLGDVMFGASACLTVDGWMAGHMLESWERGETSLRRSATAAAA